MTAGTGTGAHAWKRALAKVMKLAGGYYREDEPDNLMELAEGMEAAPGIGKAMDGLAEAVMDGLDADDAEAVQRAYCVLSAAPFIALREHLIIPGMSEGRCRTMVFLRGMGLYSTAYTRLSDADVITGRGIEPGGGILYDGPDISLQFVRDVDRLLAEDGLDRMTVPGFNPVAFPIDLMAFMADGGGADSRLADKATRLMRESIFSNGPMWAPLPPWTGRRCAPAPSRFPERKRVRLRGGCSWIWVTTCRTWGLPPPTCGSSSTKATSRATRTRAVKP